MLKFTLSGVLVLFGSHNVYGYARSQRLTGSDAASNSFTGYATSIFDDNILVGTYSAGSAYMFSRIDEAWSQTALLTAVSEGQDTTLGFPSDVGLYSSTAVVSARSASIQGMEGAGCAFVYMNTGSQWSQTAILIPEDQGAFDSFGYSVAIYADKIAVGSYLAQSPNNGTDEGTLHPPLYVTYATLYSVYTHPAARIHTVPVVAHIYLTSSLTPLPTHHCRCRVSILRFRPALVSICQAIRL